MPFGDVPQRLFLLHIGEQKRDVALEWRPFTQRLDGVDLFQLYGRAVVRHGLQLQVDRDGLLAVLVGDLVPVRRDFYLPQHGVWG